jgi:hypothetical protein
MRKKDSRHALALSSPNLLSNAHQFASCRRNRPSEAARWGTSFRCRRAARSSSTPGPQGKTRVCPLGSLSSWTTPRSITPVSFFLCLKQHSVCSTHRLVQEISHWEGLDQFIDSASSLCVEPTCEISLCKKHQPPDSSTHHTHTRLCVWYRDVAS